jgi:hypothetical protein
MDCPTCGLANPPEALACNCGHRFQDDAFPNTEDWQIRLAWRQKMAAYWSIAWPAEIGWFLALAALTSRYATPEEVTQHVGSINLFAYLSFFAIQALLVRRLVRKNYRSFRIYVIFPDGSHARRFSPRQNSLVALWVLGFQVGFITALLLMTLVFRDQLPLQILKSASSIELWLRLFIAGPYSVALALRVRYPGFRLQASGFRYI